MNISALSDSKTREKSCDFGTWPGEAQLFLDTSNICTQRLFAHKELDNFLQNYV